MPDYEDRCLPSCSHAAEERAERLLLQAYTRLPLPPQQDDGSRMAIISHSGILQVRLSEYPAKHARELPLWIELYDTSALSCVESFGCAEIEDALSAVARMVAADERASIEPGTDDRGESA
jgi:hypothetical protein